MGYNEGLGVKIWLCHLPLCELRPAGVLLSKTEATEPAETLARWYFLRWERMGHVQPLMPGCGMEAPTGRGIASGHWCSGPMGTQGKGGMTGAEPERPGSRGGVQAGRQCPGRCQDGRQWRVVKIVAVHDTVKVLHMRIYEHDACCKGKRKATKNSPKVRSHPNMMVPMCYSFEQLLQEL